MNSRIEPLNDSLQVNYMFANAQLNTIVPRCTCHNYSVCTQVSLVRNSYPCVNEVTQAIDVVHGGGLRKSCRYSRKF